MLHLDWRRIGPLSKIQTLPVALLLSRIAMNPLQYLGGPEPLFQKPTHQLEVAIVDVMAACKLGVLAQQLFRRVGAQVRQGKFQSSP